MTKIRARVVTRNVSLVNYTDVVRTYPGERTMTLPTRSSLANKFLGFNALGDPVGTVVPLTPHVSALNDVLFVNSAAEATSTVLSPPGSANRIYIHYPQGDMPLRKVTSEPSHPGKLQTADGTWFEAFSLLMPEFWGAVGDNSTDNTTAFDNMTACVNALGGFWTISMRPGAQYAVQTGQTIATNGWSILNQSNFAINFNGAQIRTKYTAHIPVGIFYFYGCKKGVIRDYASYQDGHSISDTHSTLSAGDCGITFENGCEEIDIPNYFQYGGIRGIACIRALGDMTNARCRDIRFSATTRSVHYPFSNQASADGVYGYLDTDDAGRSISMNNCRTGRFYVKSNGSPYSQDCVVSCAGHDVDVSITEDIEITYCCEPNSGGNDAMLVLGLTQYDAAHVGIPVMRGVRIHHFVRNSLYTANNLVIAVAFKFSGGVLVQGDGVGYYMEAEVDGTCQGNIRGDLAHIGRAADGWTSNSTVDVRFNRMQAPGVTGDFAVGLYARVSVDGCDFVSSNYVLPDGVPSSDNFQVRDSRFANLISSGRRVHSSPTFKGHDGGAAVSFEGAMQFLDPVDSSFRGSLIGSSAGIVAIGRINTEASTTTEAGLRITPGIAPTSPGNGDIWIEGSALKVRLNGVTKTVTVS